MQLESQFRLTHTTEVSLLTLSGQTHAAGVTVPSDPHHDPQPAASGTASCGGHDPSQFLRVSRPAQCGQPSAGHGEPEGSHCRGQGH